MRSVVCEKNNQLLPPNSRMARRRLSSIVRRLALNREFARWFHRNYGKGRALAGNRSLLYEYLEMQLDFSTKGKEKFCRCAYEKSTFSLVPVDFVGIVLTPVDKHLFDDSSDAERLAKYEPSTFHHIVVKTILLSKRARPDIQLAVVFVNTSVKGSDTYDWKGMGALSNAWAERAIYISRRTVATSSGSWSMHFCGNYGHVSSERGRHEYWKECCQYRFPAPTTQHPDLNWVGVDRGERLYVPIPVNPVLLSVAGLWFVREPAPAE